MGTRRSQTASYYTGLFNTIEVLPEFVPKTEKACLRIIKNKVRYISGVEDTNVPWYFIAIIHHMESDCNFNCQIANGQRWNKVTTIVPKGIGPWSSWEESTKDIIKMDNMDKVPQWTIPTILRLLENYNGLGYCMRGLNSPYLWSGSNHGVGVGKFVEDGKYSAIAVSNQVGAAVVLSKLLKDGEL